MKRIGADVAMACWRSGLSVLPAIRDKKRPGVGRWREYMKRRPEEIEVDAWFANPHDAMCIVCGKVSGNLECIDFDAHGECLEAWKGKVDAALLDRLVIEQSPSGGYHVLYRSSEPVEGNLKLARGMREDKLTTLIETRGEGGVFLCSPTEGYELKQGDFAHLATISPVERKALLDAARSFDEGETAVSRPVSPGANVGQTDGFLLRPGDDFSARGDIRPYLQANGWQSAGMSHDGNELWTRPGKDVREGNSATWKNRVFYVFTSSASPFEPNKGYSAFQVYGLLEHRGNFTQAARSLLDKGYGKAEDPLLGVDLSGFNPPVTQPKGVQQANFPPVSQGQQSSEEDEDIPIGELVKRYPKLRPPLINGFLRLGETMNIIAPPKTGKSWLVTDLALSVAMGTEWFGYPCNRGRVLIIDNELHKETTASRVPKVIAARGLRLDEVSPWLSVENQRGRLKTIEDISNHIEELKAEGYKLIIIDAFYRAMPRGVDENDNGAIADVYNMLDRYAEQIGCAFILIHHTSKGNQATKSVTDVGAGAGAQSRAADTHCIMRRHREKDVVVLESVVRSFPSVKPLCLRWKWPLWNPDASLEPDDLEGKDIARISKTGAEQAVEEENSVRRARTLLKVGEEVPQRDFILRIQKKYNLTGSKAENVFKGACDLGYLIVQTRPCVADETRKVRCVIRGSVDPDSDSGEED